MKYFPQSFKRFLSNYLATLILTIHKIDEVQYLTLIFALCCRMSKLYDMGVRQRQIKRWSARKPLCRTEILGLKSITVYETGAVIIMLLIGTVLAFTVLVMESLAFYFKTILLKILSIRNMCSQQFQSIFSSIS